MKNKISSQSPTDQELNECIAKYCGYTNIRECDCSDPDCSDTLIGDYKLPDDTVETYAIPAYFGDYGQGIVAWFYGSSDDDSIHSIIEAKGDTSYYFSLLLDILYEDKRLHINGWDILTASAKQRALALYRMLEDRNNG